MANAVGTRERALRARSRRALLTKPYRKSQLANMIRRALTG
jgi:hypothetical protein